MILTLPKPVALACKKGFLRQVIVLSLVINVTCTLSAQGSSKFKFSSPHLDKSSTENCLKGDISSPARTTGKPATHTDIFSSCFSANIVVNQASIDSASVILLIGVLCLIVNTST